MKSYDQPGQHIKKKKHYFANKGPSSQSYDVSSDHIWMWELDYKESWVQKNWYFWTVVMEKTLESPLDLRRYNQPILKEISPEYSLEGLMLKLKHRYFGYLMRRTDSFEKPWFWVRLKVGGEGENRGWSGWMALSTQMAWVWVKPGIGDGQGDLACCSPWSGKDLDTTEWLNWTER